MDVGVLAGVQPVKIQTRVWPLGREAVAKQVDHEQDECPFCVVARDVQWSAAGDIIFLDDGERVQRVEYVGGDGVGAVLCAETTREAAESEIRAQAELVAAVARPRLAWRSTSHKKRRKR
jgi:hypothetical protein